MAASCFFLLYLYMLFLILSLNGCFFECPAIKTLVGPSVPPMIETPFLLFCSIRLFLTNSATTIENKCKIEYGTEQGLAALIYGEKGLSALPIQDIAGEHIDTDNEYMYYHSVEFIK